MTPPPIGRRAAALLAPLALYALLVAWLTWPLAAHLPTHLPSTHPACHFDTLHMAWALAWQSHALATAPATLADANIYHPTPHALFYGDAGFGALPYFLPTFLASGNPTLAINLTFLAGVTLTAWTLHLVTRRWTGSSLAGVVAATAFLATRWTLWDFVPSAPQYAVLHYLPPIVLLAADRTCGRRTALALGALVVLQSLASILYVAVAVGVPLGVLALGRLARRTTRAAGLRLLGVLALAGLVLLVPGWGYVALRREHPGLGTQTWWRWWQQTTDLPWGLIAYQAPTAVPLAALALIAVALVLRLARRTGRVTPDDAWAHAGLWAVAGTVLSIAPATTWHGEPIWSPQAALGAWLPVYQFLRIPTRLGVGALVGLALLAGLAFAECAGRLRRPLPTRAVGLALAALVLVAVRTEYVHGLAAAAREPLPASYPLQRAIAGDSPLVTLLRAPGGPLLEVPAPFDPALGALPGPHAAAEYRSIFHWRPLLNGYNGYWPRALLERLSLAARLPEPGALARLRAETGLAVLLVHLADLPPGWRRAWEATASGARDDLRLVARDGDDVLLEVVPAP